MKTHATLLAFCCIVLSNGNPIVSNATFNSQSTEDMIVSNNYLENQEKLAETDLQQRLGARSALASLGEFPYMVSIQMNGRHFCGGALLSSKHVVTAGHCTYDYIVDPLPLGNKLTVEVGSTVIGSGRSYEVEKLACAEHSIYVLSDTLWPDDIAVITLQDDVAFSKYVQPIQLPPANFELPEGKEVTIPGYGAMHHRATISRVLKKTVLLTTSIHNCNAYYTRHIRNRQVCTIRETGYGTCEGDSGSPLTHNGWLVGIVSGGGEHCAVGDPDVFVNVSYFLPFILYEMGLHNKYDLDSTIMFRNTISDRFGMYKKYG